MTADFDRSYCKLLRGPKKSTLDLLFYLSIYLAEICDYMIETLKIWALKSKFAEKSGNCGHIFLNNSEVSNIFLGQVYVF